MKILIKPIITEKSTREASAGKFTFETGLHATKRQITHAIQNQFAVNVKSIRTIISKGKTTRNSRTRIARPQPNRKKAIVALAKGQKIALFESGAAPPAK